MHAWFLWGMIMRKCWIMIHMHDDKDLYMDLNCFYREFTDFHIPWWVIIYFSSIYIGFKMKLGRTGYLMGFIRTYVHRWWFVNVWMMMRLGPRILDSLLRIPPASLLSKEEAGASFPGCFAPDTTSYVKTLGPMFQDALLRIPPVGVMY